MFLLFKKKTKKKSQKYNIKQPLMFRSIYLFALLTFLGLTIGRLHGKSPVGSKRDLGSLFLKIATIPKWPSSWIYVPLFFRLLIFSMVLNAQSTKVESARYALNIWKTIFFWNNSDLVSGPPESNKIQAWRWVPKFHTRRSKYMIP